MNNLISLITDTVLISSNFSFSRHEFNLINMHTNVLQYGILQWWQLSESQAQLRRQEMYVPRQDIGSESDRTQCEEALNSRYLHCLSSSAQHSTFLAISTIHSIRGNKNYVRLLLGNLKGRDQMEDTGVIGEDNTKIHLGGTLRICKLDELA
jgi:hypothetical protein